MKLTDMEINEVSFVDSPANKRRFLLIKRDEGESIAISITTDGTHDGTDVKVNGETLPDMVDFHFSCCRNNDGNPISCSYSTSLKGDDGVGCIETYYLSRPHIEEKNMQFIELLKSLTGLEVTENIIKDEAFRKAVSILGEYQDLMPEDLQNAMKHLAKRAVETVVKADEDDAVSLEEIAQTSSEPAAETISQDTSMIPKDTAAITKVNANDGASNGADILSELEDTLESISRRLEVVEKTTAGKKSLDDDDGDHAQGIRKSNERWPSLSPWLGVS